MKKMMIFLFFVLIILMIFVIPEVSSGEEDSFSYKSTSLLAKDMMPMFFVPAICLLILGFLVLKG